jgi:hypothetical protein
VVASLDSARRQKRRQVTSSPARVKPAAVEVPLGQLAVEASMCSPSSPSRRSRSRASRRGPWRPGRPAVEARCSRARTLSRRRSAAPAVEVLGQLDVEAAQLTVRRAVEVPLGQRIIEPLGTLGGPARSRRDARRGVEALARYRGGPARTPARVLDRRGAQLARE